MKQEIKKNKGIVLALFALIFSITLAQAQPGGQQRSQQGRHSSQTKNRLRKW